MVLLCEMESEDEWQDDAPFLAPEEQPVSHPEEGEGEEEGQGELHQQGTDPLPDKKPRISKQEQRDILSQRRAHKPNAPLVVQCKHLWETIRVKRISKEKRAEAMVELMGLVSGKCVDIIFKHDASRIIQCCLKYGTQDQRNSIAAELKDHFVAISKSQYGKFIVSKVLRFCKDYRAAVISSFYGNVRKLIRHKDASLVIEECYSQFCNANQRNALLQEFYGPEFMLFKSETPKTLDEILDQKPSKTPGVVSHLRQVLFSILEKESMLIQSQTIIHRAILEYFRQITTRAEQLNIKGLSEPAVEQGDEQSSSANPKSAQSVNQLIEVLRDHLVHILHTREGSQVCQLALLHATPKQRKGILKTLKGFVKKIAMEQYGSAVLLTLFECVDDTVLVGKSIVSELLGGTASAEEGNAVDTGFVTLCREKYSAEVLLYLLAGGRCKSFVTGSVVDELAAMDAVRAVTSKKDIAIKRQELASRHLIPLLLPALKANVNLLARCRVASVVVLECVKACSRLETRPPGLDELVAAIAELAAAPPPSTDDADDDDHVAVSAGVKRPFNAGQKLRDASVAAQLSDSGINMNQHILVNRVSAFMLKHMIVNKLKTSVSTTAESESNIPTSPIVAALVKSIVPHLEVWVKYCQADPTGRNVTGFVLLALWETGDCAIVDAMKKLAFAKLAKDLKTWRKALPSDGKVPKETAMEMLASTLVGR